MAVNIEWRSSTGGASDNTTRDNGSVSNGATTTALAIFLVHDGANKITNVKLYITPFTGDYTGSNTAITDKAELIEWGDGTGSTFGGVQLHMNYNSGTAPADTTDALRWPTDAVKGPGGIVPNAFVARTGTGDTNTTGVTLLTSVAKTGATAGVDGEIDTSEEVGIWQRVVVPTDEDTLGKRQWGIALTYTYTS